MRSPSISADLDLSRRVAIPCKKGQYSRLGGLVEQRQTNIDLLLKARGEIDQALRRHRSGVSVLFTDVVGSTSYFERYGDTAGFALMHRHADLASSVVREFQGTVIKTIGDSVMASFDGPRNAVTAAVEIQRRAEQLNETIPERDQLLLRIGINHGPAYQLGSDVFGDVVNVAARLTSEAGPAQILVSRSVQEAVAEESTIRCRWHRKVAFKGKSEAQDVYEILWTREGPSHDLGAATLVSPQRGQVTTAHKTPRGRLSPAVGEKIGDSIGHYRILAVLGEGGMGTVYLAEDRSLGRQVAIKVLHEEMQTDETARKRFLREAKSAAALDHPFICKVYEVGGDRDRVYIAMEYLEGVTVQDRLRQGPMPLGEALRIASEIAEALEEAHDRTIVHRDLKPSNIMLTRGGHVKVMDFGLAKRVTAEEAGSQEAAATALTRSGVTLGTVPYMSPEQLRRQPVDTRSDIFSFGIVLYEMLAGIHPFQRGSTMDTASAILNEEPTPLSRYLEDVPGPVEDLVNRMLLKEKDQRCGSTKGIVKDLYQVTRGGSVLAQASQTATPLGKAFRGRRRIGLVALVVSALLILSLLWIALNVGWPRTAGTRTAGTRIAILPFENLGSEEEEEEYFSEGITRDVNTQISKIGNLVVIAHGSARRAQSQGGSYREIAEQLGADYLVDGSVSRSGTRLRITANLIDPENNEQLWANHYDEELSVSHVFTIRSDVAQQVALALDVKLSQSERAELGSRPTENLEAYQEYLLGRFYWEKRTEDGMEVAIQHFERAIALDSGFALAHAGLADAHLLLPWFSPRYSNQTGLERAQAAARRALELDPNLGEAHATLGLVQEWRFEWKGAERDFVRAIELNPEYATGRHWYANLLARLGRFDEAYDEIRKAQELDPLSPIINQDVGYVLFLGGRREAGIRQLERTLAIDPDFSTTRIVLALRLLEMGRFEEGSAQLERWAELTGSDPEISKQLALLVRQYAETGEAQSIPVAWNAESMLPPYALPPVYMLIGQEERTLEVLEMGYLEDAFGVLSTTMDPLFDPLRSHPRFVALARKTGLDRGVKQR